MDNQSKTTSRAKSQNHSVQEQSANGLGPQNAARLLGVALNDNRGEGVDSDETMGELLQARLGAIWNPENGRKPAWSRLLRPLARKRGPDSRPVVGDLLLNPRTAVGTVKAIRDDAKSRAVADGSGPEHAVRTTIYFAATASALVFHGIKTTTYSYELLGSSFERLIDKAWMPANLVDLFRRAIEICEQKAR